MQQQSKHNCILSKKKATEMFCSEFFLCVKYKKWIYFAEKRGLTSISFFFLFWKGGVSFYGSDVCGCCFW